MPDGATAAGAIAARSEKGLLAYGMVWAERESPHADVFEVRLVVPQGPTVATGAPAGVDLAKPWATVSVDRVDGSRSCSTLANPSRYSVGARRGDRWTGLSVDVRCNDGAGFDFYRFVWTPHQGVLVTNPLLMANSGGEPVSWAGGTARGVISAWPEAEQWTTLTVCGHRAGVATCFEPGTGTLVLSSAGGVVTTGTVL